MRTDIERRMAATPEVRRKLEQSRVQVKNREMRVVRCPVCGFYLLDVCGRDHYLVRVKCRKCKFNETIDTALFRTVKRRGRAGSCYRRRVGGVWQGR